MLIHSCRKVYERYILKGTSHGAVVWHVYQSWGNYSDGPNNWLLGGGLVVIPK